MAASIDHPNIVPVYGAGEEARRLYLVMRYVDGTDLHALVRRAGRLEQARAAAIVAQVAAAATVPDGALLDFAGKLDSRRLKHRIVAWVMLVVFCLPVVSYSSRGSSLEVLGDGARLSAGSRSQRVHDPRSDMGFLDDAKKLVGRARRAGRRRRSRRPATSPTTRPAASTPTRSTRRRTSPRRRPATATPPLSPSPDDRPLPRRPGVVRLPAARRRVDGDEVLLQLRQHTGYMDDHWAAAAAGHVERGETAYDAARREAREEIGVDDVGAGVRDLDAAHPARRPDRRAHRLLLHRPRVDRRAADRRAGQVRRARLVPARRRCPTPSCPHERVVLERPGYGARGVHDLRLLSRWFVTTSPTAAQGGEDPVTDLGEHADAADRARASHHPAESTRSRRSCTTRARWCPTSRSALHPDLSVPGPVAEGEDTDEGASTDGASEPEKESPA